MRKHRALSVQDVAALLGRSVHSRDAILVGGQALNIWATSYGLAADHAITSYDIDFFGDRASAIAAGRDWGGEVLIPSLDDHTPNSAVVLVEIGDEQHGIDFMSSVLGVKSDELRRWASVVHGRGYSFRVMHPLHVLQSQLENVYGSLRRRDEKGGVYHVGRVLLAVEVVSAAVRTLLAQSRNRDALNAAKRIATLSLTFPAVEGFHRDQIDVLSAIAPEGWPAEFVEKRLPQIRAQAERKRFARARNK